MATKITVLGGVPGAPPAVDEVYVYPKNDGTLNMMAHDGVEHSLVGQLAPGGFVKGSDGALTAGNSGIAGSSRQGVGEYTVTLAVAMSIANLYNFLATPNSGNPRFATVTFGIIPTTAIFVHIKDDTGAAADADFTFSAIRVV